MRKRIFILFTGVLMIMSLLACGNKYKLHLDGYGFESPKTTYADGEPVTVYYSMIATDTDYSFFLDCDDVELAQTYDNQHGYVLKSIMPAHDVTVSVKSRNSMEYIPDSKTDF